MQTMVVSKSENSVRDYVLSRVRRNPDTGCWLWNGSKTTAGYGDFRRNWKHHYAHRASYEAFVETIPVGLHVLHRCDVPACCNPEHLFLGTNRDNIADSVAKARRKGVTRRRPSGLRYHFTKKPGPANKLSDDQRDAMVQEFKRGGISKNALARRYGVSSASVSRNYLKGL